MSAIELIIGDLVPAEEAPRSTYQVDLEFMHGDADGESSRTLFFSPTNLEKLKHFLTIYHCIDEFDGELDEDLAMGCLTAAGLSEAEAEVALEWFEDQTREGDMTNDGSTNAALTSATVTWWDHNGLQYAVTYQKGE